MDNHSPTPAKLIEARLRWAITALIVLVGIGIAGYMLVEGWSPMDAAFMTIITLSTVGFTEVHPLSYAGQLFTMVLIVVGVGGMAYAVTELVAYAFEVQFPGMVRRRRMKERVAHLSNHYIICGFGRVGRYIAEELKREHSNFVVVDSDPAVATTCETAGYAVILGDATTDDTLREAGIERAKGLVTALDTDEENLYVVLSARVFRPDIFIVARATSTSAESKLKRVGADRVLTPYALAGRRMATLLLRPLVADFLDTVTHADELELLIEELGVSEASSMSGRTIGELQVRTRVGAVILAIHRRSGAPVNAPAGDTRLLPGDRLVVLGTRSQLRQMEGLQ